MEGGMAMLAAAGSRKVILVGQPGHRPAQVVNAQRFAQHGVGRYVGINELLEVGGHHDDGLGRREIPDVSREFLAEHPGHAVINDHDVVPRAGEKLQRLVPVRRFGNHVPINAEQQLNGGTDCRIVVHEKDVFALGAACGTHCHRNYQHFRGRGQWAVAGGTRVASRTVLRHSLRRSTARAAKRAVPASARQGLSVKSAGISTDRSAFAAGIADGLSGIFPL